MSSGNELSPIEAITKLPQPLPNLPSFPLPLELVDKIICHLDPSQGEAAAIRTLSKLFNAALEPYIFRELRITKWSVPISVDGGPAQDQRVMERVKVLLCAKDVHLGMVRKAIIETAPGALEDITQLLQEVSPRLGSLILPAVHQKRALYPEWFDLHLHIYGDTMSFPFLTHIRIGQENIHYPGFILALCEMAPNLDFLDIELSSGPHLPPQSDKHVPHLPFPSCLSRDTHLRRLHIIYEVTCFSCNQRSRHDPMGAVAELLRRSPKLVELLMSDYPLACPEVALLRPVIGQLRELKDLNWPGDSRRWDLPETKVPVFPSLKRLVLEAGEDIFRLIPFPPSSTLEVITINYNGNCDSPAYPDLDLVVKGLDNFWRWLKLCPRVRSLHFIFDATPEDCRAFTRMLDDAEATGKYTGTIQSLRHRGCEFIRINFRFQVYRDAELGLRLMLDMFSGSDAMYDEDRLGMPEWFSFMVYQGELVPGKVWDKMREVEGASEEEWAQRGVEVGEAAWKVLMDRRAGLEE